MKHGLPFALPGMNIGLFGGSFDPAHEGHRHVAETALKQVGLNRVWWLVTPQNPLKPKSSSLKKRAASARKQARGSRMVVTELEARLGCRYTYETLRRLKSLYPGVHFTLILGADNLTNFRQWKHWEEVAEAVPIAVVSRPGFGPRERLNAPKHWKFLRARHHPHSSAAIRAARRSAVAKPPRK